MMDLGGAIGSFSGQPLTITRFTAGSHVDGGWVDGASSQFDLDPVMVLPLSGQELQVLPDGLRTRRAVQVFSTLPLRTTEEETGIKGDRFTWDGDEFEVQATEFWAPMAGYYRAVATKVVS